MSDKEFREVYKPLHVAASYDAAEHLHDKAIFALADFGGGSAGDVINHMEQLGSVSLSNDEKAQVKEALEMLYNSGLLNGIEHDGSISYNLHKITHANEGAINPDLLAPGLD